VGVVKLAESEQGTGESARGLAMLRRAGFSQPAAEAVLVRDPHLVAGDPGFRVVVHRVGKRLEQMPQVTQLRLPAGPDGGGRISRGGHAALVEFALRGNPETADTRVQPVMDTVARLQREDPGFEVAEFGDASAEHVLSEESSRALAHAGELSVPITFAILLAVFGALVAAGIPVLLAFSAVLASGGLAALVSHVVPQSEASGSVMLLIGMAVGVDYSLFYVRRARAERRAGHSSGSALERAAATSGRAVLASGLTVLAAMAGMLLTGSTVFTSLGAGAMLVVFVAMIGSLTVLPALLGRLGDKVERGRLRRRPRQRSESRVWALLLRPVLRRPGISTALAAGLLVLLALPALGMHTSFLSAGDLPHDVPIVRTYSQIQRAFPGAPQPAHVIIRAKDVRDPGVQTAIAAMKARALASGQVREPITTEISRDGTVAEVNLPTPGNGENHASMVALQELRERVLPATLGRYGSLTYAVAGEAAGTSDFNDTLATHAPIVFSFVLGLAFLLLLVTFRSLVIPLTSIALNLLSVGAAYGVLVWIFQDGHLEGMLGFHSNGAIAAWLPLFLFSVLFGLSMDYNVFIVSRIKELRDRGATTSQAVSRGILALLARSPRRPS
jgi:RND superfamily putative drug exporter